MLFRFSVKITQVTQTHQFEINPNTQTPMMTRGKAQNKKYTWLEAFRTSLVEASTTLGLQMTRLVVNGGTVNDAQAAKIS